MTSDDGPGTISAGRPISGGLLWVRLRPCCDEMHQRIASRRRSAIGRVLDRVARRLRRRRRSAVTVALLGRVRLACAVAHHATYQAPTVGSAVVRAALPTTRAFSSGATKQNSPAASRTRQLAQARDGSECPLIGRRDQGRHGRRAREGPSKPASQQASKPASQLPRATNRGSSRHGTGLSAGPQQPAAPAAWRADPAWLIAWWLAWHEWCDALAS